MSEVARQLNVRLPSPIIEDLENIAQEENLAKTGVARRLLMAGISQWKLDHALNLYLKRQITKARAAEIAGVSIYDVLDALRQGNAPAQYTLDALQEDLQMLFERYPAR